MGDDTTKLHRSLSAGQLSMIAIGGAIGTGLFLGSGFAISTAGPSVLVSYLIGGVISLLLMGALAEMTVADPAAGSFGVFADRYLGPLGGYVIRYAYLAGIILAVGTEVTAIAIYMKFWWPAVPGLYWILGFSAALIAVNAFDVRVFGSVEYVLSLIKIVAIVGFILLGAWWVFGSSPLPGAGLQNYTADGGFFPHGLGGMWVAVIIAIFSYFSIEMIAVAAGEAADPERAIVQAFKATIARLLVFYIATIALMLAIVPWARAGEGGSPFIIVMAASGWPAAAGVVNLVILIAALSAMNSQLYVASRMLFGLAEAGHAPRALARVSRAGVPRRALAVTSLGIACAVAVYAARPETAFTLMISVATCGAMVTWMLIFVTHVAYRRKHQPEPGRFRMPGGQWTSLLGAVLMAAILITTAFTEAFRMTLVVGVPCFAVLLLIWWLRQRLRRGGVAE
ncbi:L-asparagine transporter-like permease [Brevundimonas alba]|uniref:L-asparagine transporter-like permease n=1 Tax=Brevundimonas alba TaxID=74314 RepID=A0A7X5YH06_9CAUL|nr:amino acid permease [Brevundimonas alba]NJC39836.1 L-asparagine transporter-like permease [Brevundimonas alba]